MRRQDLPIVASFFTVRAKNVEEKEIYVAAFSEKRRAVISPYESLFICLRCVSVMKKAEPLRIVCSYTVVAYLSSTPHEVIGAWHLRVV